MKLPRCAGLLLHPTSLPSPFGIGDFGDEAYRFVDQLADTGQSVWQMLPLGPPGFGASPYQALSAFAGNPLLISPELLRRNKLLASRDLTGAPAFSRDKVDYARVEKWKLSILAKAYRNFRKMAEPESLKAFERFCSEHRSWLDDYALFISLRNAFGDGHSWTDWDTDLVRRKPAALRAWRSKLKDDIEAQKYWQFEFYRQWDALRQYCADRKVRIMGDIPIYVSHNSSDVWAHQEQFELDGRGNPTVVAGVPPDYFSATGQLWGNPLYRWRELEASGFAWWIERFRGTFRLFDLVRLDHFRGFEAYWEVAADQDTAEHGRWVKAPGKKLFDHVKEALGPLHIIAENLGVITPEVEELRCEFNFPGMAVLQFAFGTDPQAGTFRPHSYTHDLFAYTGTHDNDTILGWWESEGGDSTRTPEDIQNEKKFALQYIGPSEEAINWKMIRLLFSSVAKVAIVPLQDVLGLGSNSRMNTPGNATGNWRWRMRAGAFTAAMRARLKELTLIYERAPS